MHKGIIILFIFLVSPVSAVILNVSISDTNSDVIFLNTTGISGYTQKQMANFSSIDNNGGAASCLLKADTTVNNYSLFRRMGFCYNTSVLPDDAIIVGANHTFFLATTLRRDLGKPTLGLTGFAPTSPTLLTTSDGQTNGTIRYASDKTYDEIPNSTYSPITFVYNDDGIAAINKTGYTCVMARFGDWDIDSNTTTLIWSSGGQSFYQLEDLSRNASYVSYLKIGYIIPSSTSLGYYAYGDSITRATGGGGLAADGSDGYIPKMVTTHDPTNTSSKNTDGSGKTSLWGSQNFATHPGVYPERVFINFLANDRGESWFSGLNTAYNLEQIYTNYTINGSVAYVLMQNLREDTGEEFSNYTMQRDNYTIMQNYLESKGIPVIKLYDAIDSIPRNGQSDEVNTSLMYDYIHPNKEGHRLMGEYLWDYLSGVGVEPPVCSFSKNVSFGYQPLSILFSDTSTQNPTSWNWSFGDGFNDTTQNPIHEYTDPGVYNVTLTSCNLVGCDSEESTITVYAWHLEFCEEQTGNITLGLTYHSAYSLGWGWNDPLNIIKISFDSLYISAFDNSSFGYTADNLNPSTWHRIKIYNISDYGEMNCSTDGILLTPTQIPIYPATGATPENLLLSYWWIGLIIIGIIVVLRKW